MSTPLYGGIEAGGTKFACGVGPSPGEWLEEVRIPTTSPDKTLPAVLEFFEAAQRRVGAVTSFGVASFGPIDLNPASATFGRLLPTPKPGWTGADLPGALRQRFERPVRVDTDVNAAALAEQTLGAGAGLRSVAYVTVGTGIGGGVVIDGRTVTGLMHPEMGHIRVLRHAMDPHFPGVCPFHGDCLEGLANGPAIVARWGKTLSELGPSHMANTVIADYLGQLAANIALMISCQRVVFGGGVALDSMLLPRIRHAASRMLNGYIPQLADEAAMEAFIAPAALGAKAGLSGAMLLAMA
jgi:fructokinase